MAQGNNVWSEKVLPKLRQELPIIFKLIDKISLGKKSSQTNAASDNYAASPLDEDATGAFEFDQATLSDQELPATNSQSSTEDSIDNESTESLELDGKPSLKEKLQAQLKDKLIYKIVAALVLIIFLDEVFNMIEGVDEEVVPPTEETQPGPQKKAAPTPDVIPNSEVPAVPPENNRIQPTDMKGERVKPIESPPLVTPPPIPKQPTVVNEEKIEETPRNDLSYSQDITQKDIEREAKIKEQEKKIKNEPAITPPPVEPIGQLEELPLNDDLFKGLEADDFFNEVQEDSMGKVLKEMEEKVRVQKTDEVKEQKDRKVDFMIKGRGLVYNCLGQHWACVSAWEFSKCQEGAIVQKRRSTPVTCHEYQIYESIEDCELMQQYQIDTFAPTDFCGM